ncbi:MAG: type II methionyl aminopeptidase [Nanoarchaeota archaeon]|nr:type II methionyl aminopeptidase [Nanoarchaeota archaeon]MBU1004563.1 type II methionyl aminopeptidase [Nanoarchaeota archaeon]MBU1946586.1 type II methionyl aminopeptidase [Nanoarchaeota archaeon]
MDAETIENYKKAGKIAAEALAYGKELIRKDSSVLDVLNKVEEKIISLDALPAFPAQISMNEIAAHFCPEDDDSLVFSDQVVSLDIGVHIDGCIGDNACSVDLSGNNPELIKASEEALKAAIEVVKVGVKLSEIGKAIEDTITSFGFQPVRNLSGHGLDLYNIHSSPTIPNFNTKDNAVLEKQVIAIEPFATTGAGLIQEHGEPSVFALMGRKSVRVGFVRDILKKIESYNGLPFTTRWLTKDFSAAQVRFAFNQLKQLQILHEYPPLVEKNNGLVSQAEHSLLVDDEVIVLTKV